MRTSREIRWTIMVAAYGSMITIAAAQVPSLISYQGRLVDNGALVNGNVTLSLRLYPSASGGTLAYEDATIVPVVDGLFSTFIGDDTRSGSLADALTNTEVWVEIEVDGTLLTPRERLASVGYAMVAGGVTNEAITSAMIRDKAVTAVQLADDSVNSDKIEDRSIRFADIDQNGATGGQVMKWDGAAWVARNDDDTGVADHGALTELADNDHPQYLRSDAADIFNDAGASIDLRFEGDTDIGLLFLDASADAVGIGDISPQGKLQVAGDEVRIGDAGIPDTATGDGDLYVEDDLEVDGSIYVGSGEVVAGAMTTSGDTTASGGMIVGANGTRFLEILEITGTTSTNSTLTYVDYPAGYTINNTRILSASVKLDSTEDVRYYHGDSSRGVRVYEHTFWQAIIISHSSSTLYGEPFSIVVMKMP